MDEDVRNKTLEELLAEEVLSNSDFNTSCGE